MRTHGWGGATPASDDEAIERILDAASDAIDERGADIRIADVARTLGVSRQTVNSIENGRYLPSLPLAIAMARYFATPVEQIFDTDGTEQSR